MDASNESFFTDALSDELCDQVTRTPTADNLDKPESRETERSQPMNTLDVITEAVLIEGITPSQKASERPQDQSTSPQAVLTFVMGEHQFSDSCKLGVLNEHPEALKTVTSNQYLTTSAFLNPALHAAMAELRPSIMVQVAVRLITISLRLVANILPNQRYPPSYEGPGKDKQHELAETIRHELDRALPYFHWQAARNHYGRVQYLMALLEEAIRVLAVPMESLNEALGLDVSATQAAQSVARTILDLGQTIVDVCGPWATETLFSAWVGNQEKICKGLLCLTPDSSKVKGQGVEQAAASDTDSEYELPSPSVFIRKRMDSKDAADNAIAQRGSGTDDPVCISDSEPDDQSRPTKLDLKKPGRKASRQSCRGEARREVNYNTKRHPQDKDLPTIRKRRREARPNDDDTGAQTSQTKRLRAAEGGAT